MWRQWLNCKGNTVKNIDIAGFRKSEKSNMFRKTGIGNSKCITTRQHKIALSSGFEIFRKEKPKNANIIS